jgi:hypothetical protein
MFEFKAYDLHVGDEFTLDHGETWRRVTGVVTLSQGRLRVFCLDEDDENPGPILNDSDLVIVK